jgi:hypothetical protein
LSRRVRDGTATIPPGQPAATIRPVDVVVFFALAQPHTRERTVLIVLRNMGKDKATRAKELAKDTAGAVSEEVARGAGEIKDAAKPMAGSVGTSVKDAVASGVETVGETAKDAASTVTSAVSSAIKKVPQSRLPETESV